MDKVHNLSDIQGWFESPQNDTQRAAQNLLPQQIYENTYVAGGLQIEMSESAKVLGISHERVLHILLEKLYMIKLPAKWAQSLL